MRNKVHKFCAILTLTLMPVAGGCAAYHVGPDPDSANPGFPRGDGNLFQDQPKQLHHNLAVYFDRIGDICPHVDTCKGNFSDFRSHDSRVAKCVNNYDAALITEDFSNRIRALCEDGRTLVILIHGFNQSYPEAYRAFLSSSQQISLMFPARKFAFLEVYWDGMFGSPLAIWPRAQGYSKWVGLGLRKLLNRLDPGLKVRVLTHSRGSSVICAALWNTSLRDRADEDARYLEAQRAIPLPVLPSLRIGLLAPAMRSVDVECCMNQPDGRAHLPERIILGTNPDDEALTCGGLSSLAGTDLGCNPDLFDSRIAPLLNRGRACAFQVDFAGSGVHAFVDYLLRRAFREDFLPKLLGEEGGEIASSPVR